MATDRYVLFSSPFCYFTFTDLLPFSIFSSSREESTWFICSQNWRQSTTGFARANAWWMRECWSVKRSACICTFVSLDWWFKNCLKSISNNTKRNFENTTTWLASSTLWSVRRHVFFTLLETRLRHHNQNGVNQFHYSGIYIFYELSFLLDCIMNTAWSALLW